jgi:proline iminopeptidase
LENSRNSLAAQLAVASSSRAVALNYRANGPRYWHDFTYDARELVEHMETSPAVNRLFGSVPSKADVRARLERLTMPILVLVGRHDYVVPFAAWEDLVRGLSRVTYRRFENSGHNPEVEEPAAFDETIRAWLR